VISRVGVCDGRQLPVQRHKIPFIEKIVLFFTKMRVKKASYYQNLCCLFLLFFVSLIDLKKLCVV